MGQFINNGDPNGGGSTGGTVNYGEYYQPQPKKSPYRRVVLLAVLLVVAVLGFWGWNRFANRETLEDKQTSYNKLMQTICSAAKRYANDNYEGKLEGLDVPDKIIYIRLKDIVAADLLAANLENPLTSEKISLSTDVRMKVISKNNLTCEKVLIDSDDETPPVITLLGDLTVYVKAGESYADPGATALDDKDGDITERIQRSGSVNLTKAGTYYINYIIADRAGNVSNQVVRTIIVQ